MAKLGVKLEGDYFVKLSHIDISDNPDLHMKLYNNIRTAISKVPKSKFTRSLSALLDNNIIQIGYSDNRKTIDLFYGTVVATDNTLHAIIIDLFNATSDKTELGKLLRKLHETTNKIKIANTKIDLDNITNINKLKKEREELISTIIDKIDYMQFVKAVYFEYIKFLVFITGSNEKQIEKLFTYMHTYFVIIVVRMLERLKVQLSKEKLELLDLIIDYTFYSEFSEHPTNTIFRYLSTKYPKEMITFVKRNLDKKRGLEALYQLLNKSGIAQITLTALEQLIKVTAGRDFYKALNTDLSTLVSAIIVSRYDIGDYLDILETDNDLKMLVIKLEELVFNAKRASRLAK